MTRLKAEGCAIIRSEKVSGGSRGGRAELATVLEFLRLGDELVVTRLDRLGRDTRDVLNLIREAEQARGQQMRALFRCKTEVVGEAVDDIANSASASTGSIRV